MKFLLVAVNAKYIHSNPAVYSLCAFLPEELRDCTEIAEYTINQKSGDILEDIYKRNPDVIGFSCYIWNIETVREVLYELPKLLYRVPVWLGGPEVSYNAGELLAEFPGVTGVMLGEGEKTFSELLRFYLEKEKNGQKPDRVGKQKTEDNAVSGLSAIAGLYLRSGVTAEREPMEMDALPFLYRHPERFENRIIYYESQRGCPFGCSYCLSSIEKTVRQRDLSIVKRELFVFLEHKVKQVKFVDRTFNCREAHALAIWSYLAEHDNGVTNFHFEIAAELLTEAACEVLKTMRPGLVQLEIGVQTTNPDTLRAINRAARPDRLKKAVETIHSFGNIHQHLDLIAGLPLEDYESFARSFNWVFALEPEQLQLGFLKVLHGSQMEKDAEKYGICYRHTPPYEVLYTKDISYEEICRLKKIEEMVELYYNSRQFVTTLRFLVKEFASPFSMFESLADFYKRKGFFVNQPARSYRYEVLLEFMNETLENNNAGASQENADGRLFYRECLIYDLYLRENLRTRPEFAPEPAEYKEEARLIYGREEKERSLLPGYTGFDRKQMAKMTHLEPFVYRVWEKEESCCRVRLQQRTFVLFDYENRDPLSGNARAVEVEKW